MDCFQYYVCVECSTFNHQFFIADTLDGFLAQDCSFPVVFVIIDDASEDDTFRIVLSMLSEALCNEDRYENESFVRYSFYSKDETKHSSYIAIRLKQNHYKANISKFKYYNQWISKSKYVAFCEGDDYWIDPHKLEKQVSFMDSHDDFYMCFHAVYERYEGRQYRNKLRAKVEGREYSGPEWLKGRPSQTSSFFVKAAVFHSSLYQEVQKRCFPAGDIPLVLTCANYGKLQGMPEIMSVYRRHPGGFTAQKASFSRQVEIIESNMDFAIFGEKYAKIAKVLCHHGYIRAFIGSIRNQSLDWRFLKISWQKSKALTLSALWWGFFSTIRNHIKL